MSILKILKDIKITGDWDWGRMVIEGSINLALKLHVSADWVVNQGLQREERHCQSNKDVPIYLLILNERVLRLSREKTVRSRVLTKFRHERQQVVVEVFFGKLEAAG